MIKFITRLDKEKKNFLNSEKTKTIYRKLSCQKAQCQRRQNVFILFSNLHYLRMKAIQNQRNAILSLLSLSKRKRRYWMTYCNQLCFQSLWNQRRSDLVKDVYNNEKIKLASERVLNVPYRFFFCFKGTPM